MSSPAITSITLSGETLQIDNYGRAKAQLTYEVQTDQYVGNDVAASLACNYTPFPLPQINSLYSVLRPFCLCTLLTMDRKAPTIWQATCRFEDPTTFSGIGDPLSYPANIISGVEVSQEEFWYDISGNLVCNSANSPVSSPPTRPVYTAIYTVTKIVNDAVKAAIEAVVGTLNKAVTTIDGNTWQPGELWLSLAQNGFVKFDLSSVPEPWDYDYVWTANYTIRGKRGGWLIYYPDVGFVDRLGCTPNQQIVALFGKANPDHAWPMDGHGNFESVNALPVKLSTWQATEADWSGVPLS